MLELCDDLIEQHPSPSILDDIVFHLQQRLNTRDFITRRRNITLRNLLLRALDVRLLTRFNVADCIFMRSLIIESAAPRYMHIEGYAALLAHHAIMQLEAARGAFHPISGTKTCTDELMRASMRLQPTRTFSRGMRRLQAYIKRRRGNLTNVPTVSGMLAQVDLTTAVALTAKYEVRAPASHIVYYSNLTSLPWHCAQAKERRYFDHLAYSDLESDSRSVRATAGAPALSFKKYQSMFEVHTHSRHAA